MKDTGQPLSVSKLIAAVGIYCVGPFRILCTRGTNMSKNNEERVGEKEAVVLVQEKSSLLGDNSVVTEVVDSDRL